MIEQKYDILLYTPLGKRRGQLFAKRDGTTLTGTLEILNHALPFSGDVDECGNCKISGKFITLLRTVTYIATGQISDTEIHLVLVAERGRFEMYGAASPAERKTT